METWRPTPEQARDWDERGFFIIRSLIDRDLVRELRGVIRNQTLSFAERPQGHELDPAGIDGEDPEARASQVRKLGAFCLEAPLIWHSVHAGAIAPVAVHFLGPDVLAKFGACFLKPARSGSETPWHQDNGLWRDGETDPFNFWMAVDPAVRENGCMQMIPGSHRWAIRDHVEYPDSVHAELPRDHVRAVLAEHEPVHLELDPGDVVCWHSSMYHHSPPNRSERSRIALSGVLVSKATADRGRYWRRFPWAVRNGRRCTAWPPEYHEVAGGEPVAPPPFQTVDGGIGGGGGY